PAEIADSRAHGRNYKYFAHLISIYRVLALSEALPQRGLEATCRNPERRIGHGIPREFPHFFGNIAKPQLGCVVHGSAAIVGEAVTRAIVNIGVGGALRDTFIENSIAFIDLCVAQALNVLVIGNSAWPEAGFFTVPLVHCLDFCTGSRAVAAFLVVIPAAPRSEEHTSELQSRENLVCRL